MIDKQKISIIIPVHNPGKYLIDCLLSVIEQSYKNIEIIIVNDDSTDGSIAIIEDFQKKDSRIKYFFTNQHNAALTRREGIRQSTAEYVCFVDSDDIIDKQYVKALYDALCNSGLEISTAKIANFTNESDISNDFGDTNRTKVVDNLLSYFVDNYHSDKRSKFVSQSIDAKMFKKELLENLDYSVIKTNILEDNFILPQILRRVGGQEIAMLDKTLYFYRSTQGSTMWSVLSKKISYDGREIDYPELFDIAMNHLANIYKGHTDVDMYVYKIKAREYYDLAKLVVDKNIHIDNIEARNRILEIENKELNTFIYKTLRSTSHRIGRAVTFPARRLKRTIRAIKD